MVPPPPWHGTGGLGLASTGPALAVGCSVRGGEGEVSTPCEGLDPLPCVQLFLGPHSPWVMHGKGGIQQVLGAGSMQVLPVLLARPGPWSLPSLGVALQAHS